MPLRKLTIVLASCSLVCCVLIFGCANSAGSIAYFQRAGQLSVSMLGESSQRPLLLASLAEDPSQVPLGQRVVIYNAALRIVVSHVDEAIKEMERIAELRGGYVQRIKMDQITIRIPVQQYQSAVASVEELGQVTERELEALDVTEEFVDLEARLRNAKNVRNRFEALLERAETVEAALAVEKELQRVNEEIERLKAKLELIKNRMAFSTILTRFERVARQTEITKGFQQLPFRWLRDLDPNRLWNP